MNVPRGWRGAVVFTAFVLLSSCTENADLFSSLDEPETAEIVTVSAGTIVASGGQVSIQIAYPQEDEERATTLTAELRSPNGTVMGSVSFDSTVLAEPELPAIELPDPGPGVYLLSTVAWRGEELLFSDERQLFLTDEAPTLFDLTVLPTSIGTQSQSQALAVAEVSMPGTTRPYLRWLFDGAVIGQGYLTAGGDRAVISGTGLDAGAYQVLVEIYPWGPAEGARIDGSTVLSQGTDVYVRSEPALPQPDQDPHAAATTTRFYSLDGTLSAHVVVSGGDFPAAEGHTALPVKVSDSSRLDVVGGALGYRVADGTSVAVPLPGAQGYHLVTLALDGDDPDDSARLSLGDAAFVSIPMEHRKQRFIVLATSDGTRFAPLDYTTPAVVGPRDASLVLTAGEESSVFVDAVTVETVEPGLFWETEFAAMLGEPARTFPLSNAGGLGDGELPERLSSPIEVVIPSGAGRRGMFILPPGTELHIAPSGLVLSQSDGSFVLSDSRGGVYGRVPTMQTSEDRPPGRYDLELVETAGDRPRISRVAAADGQDSRTRIEVPEVAGSVLEVAVRSAPGTLTAPVMPGVVVFQEP